MNVLKVHTQKCRYITYNLDLNSIYFYNILLWQYKSTIKNKLKILGHEMEDYEK